MALANAKSRKQLAMLGIESETKTEDGPDIPIQSDNGLFIPKELEDAELERFTIEQLISYHSDVKVASIGNSSMFGDDEKGDFLMKGDEPIYQLVFDIKHCIFSARNNTTLLFSIFDDKRKMFLSEEYCLTLTEKNFPTVGAPEDCKVLFRDLKQEDIDSDLYIVCRIYRFGPMEAPDMTNNKKKKTGMKDVIRPYGVTVIPLREQIPKLLRPIGIEVNFEPGTAQIFCPKEEAYFVQLPFDIIDKKKNAPYTIAPMSIGIAHSLTLYQGQCEDVEKTYQYYDKLTHIHPLDVNPQTHSERHELYVTLLDAHVHQRNKRSACNVMCKISLRNEEYESVPGVVMMGRGGMAQPQNEHESPVYYHTNDPSMNQTYVIIVPSSIKEMEKCHLFISFWHTPATTKKMDERGFAFLPLFDPKLRQLKANKVYALDLYRMDKKPINYLNNPNLKAEGKQIEIFYRLCSTKVLPDNDIHTFMTWEDQEPKMLIPAIQRVSRKAFGELMQILDEFMKAVFGIMFKMQKDPHMVEQSFFALIGILGEVNKGVNIRFKNRIEEWIQSRFEYPGLWKILADQILKLLKWIASDDAKKAEMKDASPDLARQGAEIARQLTKAMRGIQYLFLLMKRSMDLEIQQNKESKAQIQNEYENKINAIFDGLNRVMGLTEPRTVTGVQSFAMKGFLNLFACLPTQESQDLTKRAVKFVESAKNTGVVNSVEKLLLMLRILENPKFSRKDIVEIFLPCVAKELEFHMSESIDEQIASAIIIDKCVPYLDPKRPRTLKSIERNAVRVVHDGKGCEPTEELLHHFTHLLLKYFSTLDNIRKVDISDVSNAQRIFGKTVEKNPAKRSRGLSVPNIEAVTTDQIAIHRTFLVTAAELSRLLTGGTAKPDTFSQKSDRVDTVVREERTKSDTRASQLISGVLKCCHNLLQESLFPRSWVLMRMVEAELGMRAFSWFGSTLRANYMEASFSKTLWDSWLGLGMLFLSHRDFAIEDMSNQRADIMRENYGDIRNIAISQLRTAWDVLKAHRSELAETMVTAAIAASASDVSEIQEFAVDVYFQMMKSEFETTNEMRNVETHTIDQVDLLTAEYSNDEKIINRYLDFFRKRVSGKLANSNTKLKKIGEQFIMEIEKLYEYLVQLRKLPNDATHEDERTSATLKLLSYLDKGGKAEMYNRYIHRLALMHSQLGNSIEAGQCFVKHASRLQWSDRVLRSEPTVSLEEQPEWRRHVQLLENAYQQFQIGEAWEMAVRVCQELSRVYETQLFDLKALSAQLEKESQCWKFISQHDRVFQTHFLLSFRGDFSDELRGADFIYRSGRGKNPESVMDFTNRIKAKWKDAKVMNSSDPIPSEYDSPDFKGQFIRIAKLNPSSPEEMEGGDFKWDKTKAPLRMKQYYREMELTTFYFTYQDKQKKKKEENEFRNLWITQVFVIAEETIPSIRRRIGVVKQISKTLSPLQTAVNNLNTKTQELIKLVEACENDPSHDIRSLSMSVNGVLDAAVMGGVTKYQEAFFDSDYFDEMPQEKDLGEKFKEALRLQLVEAEKALAAYSKYRPGDLADHVTHLEGCLIKMKRDLMEFLAHPRRKF